MAGVKATWSELEKRFAFIECLTLEQGAMLIKTLEKIIECEAGIDEDNWCERCKGLAARVEGLAKELSFRNNVVAMLTKDPTPTCGIDLLNGEDMRKQCLNCAGPCFDKTLLGCGGCTSTRTPLVAFNNDGSCNATCSMCGWGVVDKRTPQEAVRAYWLRVVKEGLYTGHQHKRLGYDHNPPKRRPPSDEELFWQ